MNPNSSVGQSVKYLKENGSRIEPVVWRTVIFCLVVMLTVIGWLAQQGISSMQQAQIQTKAELIKGQDEIKDQMKGMNAQINLNTNVLSKYCYQVDGLNKTLDQHLRDTRR